MLWFVEQNKKDRFNNCEKKNKIPSPEDSNVKHYL